MLVLEGQGGRGGIDPLAAGAEDEGANPAEPERPDRPHPASRGALMDPMAQAAELHLATGPAALAAAGEPVLLIDFDPQGNASTGLGISRQARTVTSYDVLLGARELAAAVVQTAVPRLAIVPASVDLSGAELEVVDAERREYRLREALAGKLGQFRYVLIDCPPSLGLLTLNALVAAHAVLVPMQCEFYALEGLSHLVKTIELVRQSLNPAIRLEGILLTMFDGRVSIGHQVTEEVKRHFPKQV